NHRSIPLIRLHSVSSTAVQSASGRIQMRTKAIALVCIAASAAISSGILVAQSGGSRPPVTAAQYDQWKRDLSNWGRWGTDDQIGALNLITPAKRRQAAALVKDGISVSLAADADTVQAVDNPTPYEVVMKGIGSDRIAVNYPGTAHTHLDS